MRRQTIAAGLIRAVRDAEQESQAIGSAIPLQREAILRCRDDLLALAARVESGEPASAVGLMLANALVTDVESPLYQGSGDLRAETRKALAAFGVTGDSVARPGHRRH